VQDPALLSGRFVSESFHIPGSAIMSEVMTARPRRPSLAEQLDRLDSILDALADGLTQAVAEAARQGIRPLVQEVLVALLSDPELRRLLLPPPPVPVSVPVKRTRRLLPIPRRPRIWTRMRNAVIGQGTAFRGAVRSVVAGLQGRYRRVRSLLAANEERIGTPFLTRRVIAVTTSVTLLSAIGGLFLPITLVSVLAGLGVGVVTFVGQLLLWATTPSSTRDPSGARNSR
jgi:hypothetical protein